MWVKNFSQVFDTSMVVIDWLQTSEFIRQNSERFVLYSLCGCFLGIAVLLLSIIIVLYLDQRHSIERPDYQTPRTDLDYHDILTGTNSILPIYRYDGRTHQEFYHV